MVDEPGIAVGRRLRLRPGERSAQARASAWMRVRVSEAGPLRISAAATGQAREAETEQGGGARFGDRAPRDVDVAEPALARPPAPGVGVPLRGAVRPYSAAELRALIRSLIQAANSFEKLVSSRAQNESKPRLPT